jgi:methionyl-tRNA formyltransferase
MTQRTRVVIITSDQLRHRYYCSRLAEALDVVGIIAEAKGPATSDFSSFSEDDQQVIKKHFSERDQAEKKLLGQADFPNTEVNYIPFNTVNSREVLDWIMERNPDIILLYGSSIIKDPVLSHYNGKIVNLHLGLSPYYRGSGTNFWPLVNGEPECVGGTIHLAVEKVDAGSILHQVRPDAEADDRAHELGTKVIIKAAKELPLVLAVYLQGKVEPQQQDLKMGALYKNKDFNADAVRKMWNNFENGMMEQYLQNKEARMAAFPLVQYTGTPQLNKA